MNGQSNGTTLADVSESTFQSEVLHAEQPTLVAFEAPWSKACQILQSVLQEVAGQCRGTVRVFRMNVDNYPEVGMWYDIQSIPTLVCFVKGQVRFRIVGTASKEAILAKLQPIISNP